MNMTQVKKLKRSTFTKEEDRILLNFVQHYGEDWNLIASLMIDRNPRQVRERYHHYLDPSITKDSWSKEEDLKLIKLVGKYGSRWKKISESFDGRNEVSVKNRWNYYLSKHCSEYDSMLNENSQNQENQSNDQIMGLMDDEIISFLIFQENINQKTELTKFDGNEVQKNFSSMMEEKINHRKESGIFPFYRDEDIELSLYSIELLKFSDIFEDF
jgi:myb proto-oncogene protein